ncbi:pre-peptidase C-terminal domain-containing protein [Nocardioides stalactiti]|uniref:pre-peptidase C-terminal domain-containing protein n=1 Tax=Nocardioides stalactiti TaxID=2755356 RepID=UPI00160490CF|nr:pre-peptidase C-terminal domain-containing protein [Nocardioides stalactiti]
MNKLTVRRSLATLALAAAAVAGATNVAAPASAEAGHGPAKKDVSVDTRGGESVTGRVAVDELGDQLDEVADRHGLSADKLRKTLLHDKTLKVTDNGSLVFADEPLKTGQSSITDNIQSPLYPTADTFALHSRPSSPYKLYLDFTGNTTSGTQWNSQFNGGRAIVSAPFDLDGNPGSFSTREHAVIQAVWLQVREDYAPFHIDVTTQDPGLDGLRRTSADDGAYGVRMVISPSNAWYPNAGGVAYLNTFGEVRSGTETTAFVFTNTSGAAKYVGEASSHEAGHTLGLSHDGNASQTYHPGSGNWAPIMGLSYYKPVTQWSNGSYAGANNQENDVAKIAAKVYYAADDYTNSTSSTGTLPAGTARYGIINSGDVDLFRFSLTGTRTLKIAAWGNTGPVDTNLNLRITLRDANLNVVGTWSPNGDLQVSTPARTLGQGTYYVQVDGPGEGVYSSYGSLGFYGIQLSWA